MIEAHNVSVVRRGRALLDGVSVSVRTGRVAVVVGPNGAGKSTLIKVLSGEINPDSGTVTLDGQGLGGLSPAIAASRRAVVPQSTNLSFPFTAIEVVLLGATVPGFGLDDRKARKAGIAAIEAVGLAGFEGRLYTELSGGERQRVHVARALCQLDCAVRDQQASQALILDEPTASLDLAHQLGVLGEVRRRARLGAAVFLVLHDLNLAASYADELILLERGKVAAAGASQTVFDDALLSRVFSVNVHTNCLPAGGTPFLLPQAVDLPAAAASRADPSS